MKQTDIERGIKIKNRDEGEKKGSDKGNESETEER